MQRQPELASSDVSAFAIIAWQLAFTVVAIRLSLMGSGLYWVIGELLLAIGFFQWFVIHHDLAHGAFFRTRLLNNIFGHLSSIFCLIPFFSWKQVHHHHHIWTGWKDKDPSDPLSQIKQPKPITIRLMNFCWKYWIPVFAMTFVTINFWNLKRVNALFPDRKSRRKNLFSVLFLCAIYAFAFAFFAREMVLVWLPAMVLFLMVSDPILLTQHVHIDANYAGGKQVKAFRFRDQPVFARNIVYPKYISKYFFYNSERHGLHHQHPDIPIYHLGKLPSPAENNIGWSEWLRIAKSMPADVLIFKTSRDSGIRL